MNKYPKKIKSLLRDWLAEAYERELHRELSDLEQSFIEWRSGAICSGELSHRIHQYEQGPSRELYNFYNNVPHDMAVAYAVVAGILRLDEIPYEVLKAIERHIAFYEAMKADGELKAVSGDS